MLGSACSGDDGADEPDGEDGTDEQVNDPVDGTTAVEATLEIVEPSGDALLGCVDGGATADATVVHVEITDALASEPGLTSLRFATLVGDHNRRCGTDVEVVSSAFAASDDCGEVTERAPTLAVVSGNAPAFVACLADAGVAVWSEAGVPADFREGGAVVLSTAMPPEVEAELTVGLLESEGLLVDADAAVITAEGRTSAAAGAGFVAGLEAAEVVVDTATIDGDCAGADDDVLAASVVVTVAPAACQLALAQQAVAAGATPLWVVFDVGDAVADDAGVDLGAVEQVMDVALAYSAMPATGAGWPLGLDPTARDGACVAFLDELTGATTTYPDRSWLEAARLCTTAAGVLALIGASEPGADLTGAVDAVTDIAFPRGQLGSLSVDEPWLGPAQLFALEWSRDCGCWTHVAGPLVP